MTGGVSAQQLEWSLGINLVAIWLEIGPESLSYYLMLLLNHSLLMILPCKGMKTGNEPSFVDGAPVHDQLVEMVKEFPYLGSTICNDGEVDNDVKIKTAKPANAFGYLKKPIFTSDRVSVNVKRAVYKAVVLATLLHGLEC